MRRRSPRSSPATLTESASCSRTPKSPLPILIMCATRKPASLSTGRSNSASRPISFGLYREVTVSGMRTAIHWSRRQGSELHRKFTVDRKTRDGVELYRNCARYITISGLQEGPCESLRPINDYLDTLMARFDSQLPTRNRLRFQHCWAAGRLLPRPDRERRACRASAARSFRKSFGTWRASAGRSSRSIDELAKYPNGIGQKYAGRLLAEVTRSFGKWAHKAGGVSELRVRRRLRRRRPGESATSIQSTSPTDKRNGIVVADVLFACDARAAVE